MCAGVAAPDRGPTRSSTGCDNCSRRHPEPFQAEPVRALPDLPPIRRGVFTVGEARTRGWTAPALSRACDRADISRLRRGIYALPVPDGPRRRDVERTQRAIAASLSSPHVVVSHLADAELRGWPVWAPRPRDCAVVLDHRTRVPGHHVHRTPLPDPVELLGFRHTGPLRTIVDIACEFGSEAGLVVADAAARQGAVSADKLADAIERARGRTGIARARPLPALLDPLAESLLESRSRWQFHVHGIPPPRTQVVLRDLDGAFLGRADFYWENGVVGEVDGAGKLENAADRAQYLRRQHALTRVGLRAVRWGPRELDAFGPTAAWLDRELATPPLRRGWVVTDA